MRQTHNVKSNTPEWFALRATFDGTASEAPAMMGESSYKSRDALLAEKATGLEVEVNSHTQALFDAGHLNERLARPIAEKIIGEDLYPVTVSDDVQDLNLGASLDGETIDGAIIWEHKTLNSKLAESVPNNDLAIEYRIQMEQQLMISGAEKCLFMASKDGNEKTMVHTWYHPDLDLRQKIIQGWVQFKNDFHGYEPVIEVQKKVAKPVTDLPLVSVSVSGAIDIADNFKVFEQALTEFIDEKLIREPKTDQDFADLDLQIKSLKKAEAALNAAEVSVIAQIEQVDTMKRTKDMLYKLARDNRLVAEKLLEQKKQEIKRGIFSDTTKKFANHIASLNELMGDDYMPPVGFNLAEAMKGKRTIVTLQGAANDELAKAKIESNEIADKIRGNLKTFQNANGAEYPFLFMDKKTILLKEKEDFLLLVQSRISRHKETEEKKLKVERERIRAEEQAKAEAEQRKKAAEEQAELDRVEREKAEQERKTRAEEDLKKHQETVAGTSVPATNHGEGVAIPEQTNATEKKSGEPQGKGVQADKSAITETITQSLIDNGIGKIVAKRIAALIIDGKINGVWYD